MKIGGNSFREIPPGLLTLTKVTYLSAADNRLFSLSPMIGRLTALTDLSLFKNRLTSLPREIGRLHALWALTLDQNRLSSLPSELGFLPNLSVLLVGLSERRDKARLTRCVAQLNINELTWLPRSFERLQTSLSLDVSRGIGSLVAG